MVGARAEIDFYYQYVKAEKRSTVFSDTKIMLAVGYAHI
jgi:hypothetical protein